MANRITAEDIHNLIQKKLGRDIGEKPKIANLLEMAAGMPRTPSQLAPNEPLISKQNSMPTIPDANNQQELMGTNALAQRYPGLGAR